MKIGDRIGNIRIEKRLGQGGMGEVFEGFDERLLRRVAVKALNTGSFSSEDARARFLLEAQILSKLDHPNICRIHGLEESDESDFLVLEMLEGKTLSDTAQKGMSREEKLRCARGIAEALDTAHREGIIHRDLKPENVMVVGSGHVKVLDFGIARLLDEPLELEANFTDLPLPPPTASTAPTEIIRRPAEGEKRTAKWTKSSSSRPILTERGALVGTPAYMSPEQARGDELTQASDLYSLGILLQELFSGSPAYEPAPTPVARIAQVAEGASRQMAAGDPSIVRLVNDLKSLDPSDRPTARETVERIDWILQGPVRARRRRLVTIGGLAMLALLAVTVVVSLRMARPEPLLQPGQAGRVVVLPFINDTGDPANNWVRHGLMELVAQTLDAIDGISVVSPAETLKALDVRALSPDQEIPATDIHQILDGAGAHLGLAVRLENGNKGFSFHYKTYNIAGSVGEHSLDVSEPTSGANKLARRIAHRLRPESPLVEVFDRFSDQPLVNQIYAMGVEALHGSGATAAHPYFEVALDRDPDLQWARIKLAECLEMFGDNAQSKGAAVEVLEAARVSHRSDLERSALLQLAVLMRRSGEYGHAREYYEEVLELAQKQGDRTGVADATRGLGVIAYFEGDFDAAENRFEESLAIYREVGDRTGEMYSIGNLSALADGEDDLERAEALDTEALMIARETGNLKGIADFLNNLGVSARYQGQFDRAESLYGESLVLQRRLGNRIGEANTLHNLGDMAKDRGRLEKACSFSREALAIFEELEDSLGIGRASVNLAECLLLLGRLDEAKAPLQQAVAWNPNSSLVLAATALQAYRQDRFREARRLQEMAKNAADDTWQPTQQARLVAFVEAERVGHPIPLPLESRQEK